MFGRTSRVGRGQVRIERESEPGTPLAKVGWAWVVSVMAEEDLGRVEMDCGFMGG